MASKSRHPTSSHLREAHTCRLQAIPNHHLHTRLPACLPACCLVAHAQLRRCCQQAGTCMGAPLTWLIPPAPVHRADAACKAPKAQPCTCCVHRLLGWTLACVGGWGGGVGAWRCAALDWGGGTWGREVNHYMDMMRILEQGPGGGKGGVPIGCSALYSVVATHMPWRGRGGPEADDGPAARCGHARQHVVRLHCIARDVAHLHMPWAAAGTCAASRPN